jgi:hypothetical protein
MTESTTALAEPETKPNVLTEAVEEFTEFGLLEADVRGLQDCLGRLQTVRDEFDFLTREGLQDGKHLPYKSGDQGSLDTMQEASFKLARDPNIIAATEAMLSYTVANGWKYTVANRDSTDPFREERLKAVRTAHQYLVENVHLGNLRGWYFMQEETYRRYVRDGEFFRRWFYVNGEFHVRFMEPMDVRQPTDPRQVISPVPSFVASLLEENVVPGEFGIVAMPGDAAMPVGYWHRISQTGESDEFEYVPASQVQHGKNVVDVNDPRGVPPFLAVGCVVALLQEVTQSMAELAIKQSKYAVVHKHAKTNRRAAVQNVIGRRAEELNSQMSTRGRDPLEHHLKNIDVEMHGFKVNARNYIEVIQALQRSIGSIRQIPEFMFGDANTGNRSSLVSATGPFSRRVLREQTTMWFYEQELQWIGIAAILGWQPDSIKDARAKVIIRPSFPLTEQNDKTKEAQMVISLASETADHPAIISVQEAARRLNVDYNQMQSEISRHRELYPAGTSTTDPGVESD